MSTILNLSDKFANDLNKFFIWANENDYVVKKDDEVVNWSLNMLPDFIEPSRNKINAYVKELFQFYKLYDKNNLPIEETFIKIIIKEFKENKPTLKKSKKNEIDEITDDIQNANREPSSTNKRKYTKRSIKNMTEQNMTKQNMTDENMTKQNMTDEKVEIKMNKKSKKNEIDEITDDIQNANREPSSTNKRKYTKRSIKNMTEQNMTKQNMTDENMTKQNMTDEKVEIKMNKNGIKLVHKNWDISINENVTNLMSIIEYIGNQKDEIITELKKQQMNENEQKKENAIKKQKVDKPKIQEKTEPKIQEKIELDIQEKIEPKIQEKIELDIQEKIEPKIQEKIELDIQKKTEPKIQKTKGLKITNRVYSLDLEDEFDKITLDDIEF